MTTLDKAGNRVWTLGGNEFDEVYYMKLCRTIMPGSKITNTVWRDIDQIQRWYTNSIDLGNLRMLEWQYGFTNRDVFHTKEGYSKLMTGKWFNENLRNNPNWHGFYSIWTENNDHTNLGMIDINGIAGYTREQLIDFLCRRIRIKSLYGCINDDVVVETRREKDHDIVEELEENKEGEDYYDDELEAEYYDEELEEKKKECFTVPILKEVEE